MWELSIFLLAAEDNKLSSLIGVKSNGLSHLWDDRFLSNEFVAVVLLFGVAKLSSLLFGAVLCRHIIGSRKVSKSDSRTRSST